MYQYTGWCFGTMEFYDFPETVGNNNDPNWRTHIFQRGWNHQPVYVVAIIITLDPLPIIIVT